MYMYLFAELNFMIFVCLCITVFEFITLTNIIISKTNYHARDEFSVLVLKTIQFEKA